MADHTQHCADLVRAADRDRYLATLFAPADKRGALFALYAFNAEIARVRDLVHEPMAGEIRLQWWREAIEGKREGEARAHPVAAALLEAMREHRIAADRLVAIVDAREGDLYDDAPATRDDFDNYAVLTDGALIMIAADILGASGPSLMMLARHAGIAQAITDRLVQLARLAARGQMPVPLDLLTRQGVSADDVRAARRSDALKRALSEWRGHARRQLSAAGNEAPFAPIEMLPAMLPLCLVAPTLKPMERRGYDPFDVTPLSGLRRQWLIWRAARDPRRIFA